MKKNFSVPATLLLFTLLNYVSGANNFNSYIIEENATASSGAQTPNTALIPYPLLPPQPSTPVRPTKKALPSDNTICYQVFAAEDELLESENDIDLCCMPPACPQTITDLTKPKLQIQSETPADPLELAVFINLRNTALGVFKLNQVDLTKSNFSEKDLSLILKVLCKSCNRNEKSPKLVLLFDSKLYQNLFTENVKIIEECTANNIFFIEK